MKANKLLAKNKKILDKVYDNAPIIVIVVVFALLIIGGILLINYSNSVKLRDNIYSQLTCTCCNGDSLLDTGDSCFMAGGMREYVKEIIKTESNEEIVMIEALKKFGIRNLMNDSLIKEYGLIMLNNTEDTANLTINPREFDIGTISNSKGIVISDFKVKNVGSEDLIITDLKTSCSCLTASFIKEGRESVRVGRFSHSEGWTFVLQPNEEAILRAYYDPRVTNWQTGHVERIITITSNDPVFFETGVKIIANLVP